MIAGIFFLAFLAFLFTANGQQEDKVYQVYTGEVLYYARTPLNAWSGLNRSLKGFAYLTGSGKARGWFCLQLSEWDSGDSLRDAHTREMFEIERFPYACFFPKSWFRVKGKRFKFWGTLNLHGQSREWIVEGALSQVRERLELELHGSVSLASFGLRPPRFLLVSVEDTVLVKVRMILVVYHRPLLPPPPIAAPRNQNRH